MIKMRFISIVVKIAALDKIYNGGFEQFRKDYITKIEAAEKDGRLDKDLLCFSVMNPMDTSDIVSMFEEIGLIPTEVIDGEKCWKDLCIIEVPFGLTKRCDWIMYYGPIAAYVDKKENRERVKQEVFEYYEFKKRQNTLKELEREIEKQKVKDDVQIEGNFNIREVFLSWDEKSEVFPEKIYDALFTSKNLDIHSLRMAYHNLCKIKDNAEYYTFLGIIYYNISNDKIKEISEPEYYFRIATEKGSVHGAYNLAVSCDNLNEKFHWYLQGANNALKKNDQTVTYDIQRDVINIVYTHLAIMYHKGMGVARNEDEAEKWYKIAVKRGSYKAMLNLGVLYIEQGLSSKAIELYSESLNILINKKKSAPDIDMMKNNLMILLNQDDEQLAFCHIASSYIDYIKKEEKSLCNSSNLNGMIRELPELKLDKGYLLDDYRERNCDNSTLNLYVRPFGTGRPSDEEFGKIRKNIANQFWFEKLLNGFKKGEKKEYIIPKLNPFDYITLPCTKTAIWEAYLLQQSWHIIGMRWHGYYEHRIFINSPKDIAKIDELDSKEIKQQIYKIWDSSLYPCITIRDSKACIKHCWFDKWKGLVQITCNVTYNPKINRISKFEFEDEKVLVKYNCGYMF